MKDSGPIDENLQERIVGFLCLDQCNISWNQIMNGLRDVGVYEDLKKFPGLVTLFSACCA